MISSWLLSSGFKGKLGSALLKSTSHNMSLHIRSLSLIPSTLDWILLCNLVPAGTLKLDGTGVIWLQRETSLGARLGYHSPTTLPTSHLRIPTPTRILGVSWKQLFEISLLRITLSSSSWLARWENKEVSMDWLFPSTSISWPVSTTMRVTPSFSRPATSRSRPAKRSQKERRKPTSWETRRRASRNWEKILMYLLLWALTRLLVIWLKIATSTLLSRGQPGTVFVVSSMPKKWSLRMMAEKRTKIISTLLRLWYVQW